MAPDIETYAPFIEAVFDSEGTNIPYQIADRAGTAGSPNLEGFLEILKLNLGRFTAAEVLSLLEVTAIRNRFGLTENDLNRISNWVADSGIRWGIDGSSRRREGLPDISANTWEWGLERLLLGYALPTREGDCLPISAQ
jgi:exodeoxyribonuclease V gamma subunit